MSEHRLIYADELYDTLANKLTWLMMKYSDEVYLEVGKDIRKAIDDQPTAYDIDKVISYIDRVANSGLGKSKSLEYIKKYVKAV